MQKTRKKRGLLNSALAEKICNMKINWNQLIYNSFIEETRVLCDDAKKWLIEHEPLSKKYILQAKSDHPALWFSEVMNIVEEAIDAEDQNAVDLGCLYVIAAQKAPFGKIHKSNVLVRLLRNHKLIKHRYFQHLESTHEKLVQMKYPPREVRELSKLLVKIS